MLPQIQEEVLRALKASNSPMRDWEIKNYIIGERKRSQIYMIVDSQHVADALRELEKQGLVKNQQDGTWKLV